MNARDLLLVALAPVTAATLGGCGKNTALSVTILVPPDSDPFADASTAVIALHGDNVTQAPATAMVSGGKFSVSLEIDSPPRDNLVYMTLDAQSASGVLVGHARTPLFGLPDSDAGLTVYVGRPGRVTQSAVKLFDDTDSGGTSGRKALAGASLLGKRGTPVNDPSAGAVIVGGVNDSAQPLVKAWRYNPITHTLNAADKPMVARQGAVLVPSADTTIGNQALLWGGANANGDLITNAENFDPSVQDNQSMWNPPDPSVADAGPPGAYAPTVVEAKDGVFLISGGRSKLPPDGVPLAGALLVQRVPGATSDQASKLGVSRLPSIAGAGPMLAARTEHSATRVTLAGGSGALLFGGLSYADSMAGKPVAELFQADKNVFQPFDIQPAPPKSRRGHASIDLPSGKVLIVGGYQEDAGGARTVLDSALVIDPNARTYVQRDAFLHTGRYAATLTAVTRDGNRRELLLCGGFDSTGAPIASCEIFSSADTLDRMGDPVPLPHARAGHLALQLETDNVLLVGGFGDGMRAVADIDIYTALQN